MDLPTHRSVKDDDWDHAVDVIQRLGVARSQLLHDAVTKSTPDRTEASGPNVPIVPRQEPIAENSAVEFGSDELSIAVAEIEQASAALRQTEPTLEFVAERPDSGPAITGANRVLTYIAVLWISVVLLAVGCIYALAALAH
jgi:hypothetical protein